MPRIAIFQMSSGIDPEANSSAIVAAIEDARRGGADMLFTPEMCTLLDRKRSRAAKRIEAGETETSIRAVQAACRKYEIWCSLGSVPLLGSQGRLVNRSIIIDNQGNIAQTYDKIHMFDVDLETGESWRESSAYDAGNKVVSVETPVGKIGLTICYDIRFPALFEALGTHCCDILSIPAAFTVPTGADHWHVLLRARAIEASAFVIAAAQVGDHEDGRATYGHSLVVDPWGKVLLDLKDQVGLGFADIDLGRIAEVRAQLPSLANRRDIPRSYTS